MFLQEYHCNDARNGSKQSQIMQVFADDTVYYVIMEKHSETTHIGIINDSIKTTPSENMRP